ncbi:MAG: hypothetical protein ACR2I8_00765 [Steroidobacteraceae bacterium]
MNAARLARLAHRWLALVIGAQLLIWTVSGLYMAAVDIDLIHGDPLVHHVESVLPVAPQLAELASLRDGRADIVALRLRTVPDDGQLLYEIVSSDGTEWVDARTGLPWAPLAPPRVRALAERHYAGSGQVAESRLLLTDAQIPFEIRGRRAPLWQVRFDDWLKTTLYLEPHSGALVTRRHRLWRWFDALWALHIMDYRERENLNNPLLRVATPLALLLASSGAWLALYSFGFLQRRRRARGAVS